MLPSKSFRVGFGQEDETVLELCHVPSWVVFRFLGLKILTFFFVGHIRSQWTLKNWNRSRFQSQKEFVSSFGSESRVSSDLQSSSNQDVIVCPSSSPFFLLSLVLCGCRTTRSGGSALSWRCRTRARTCWLQTARPRWRIGSTRSTRSCTAALRSPCRRRGTETFTTVCVYTAPVGARESEMLLINQTVIKC